MLVQYVDPAHFQQILFDKLHNQEAFLKKVLQKIGHIMWINFVFLNIKKTLGNMKRLQGE